MKSRSNPSQTAQTPAAPPASYAPSVPISVYRELAAELDATRAILETVHTENQQLKLQNQQLRQEVDRMVQSALNLRSYTESSPVISQAIAPPAAESESVYESVAAQLRTAAPEIAIDPQPPAAVIASTQVADLPPSLILEEKSRPFGGLWMMVIVVAVVIGAFGAGFFMVKPLLQNR